MSTTTQSTTPATLPAGVTLALDVVGSAAAPAAGDGIPYSKLDIGAAGASSPVTTANPLPISDAGGSVTVDGSVAVSNFPASQAVTGTFWQAAQPVTDNAGSLTVDAPVGTPVFTRLSDGTAALTTAGGRLSVDASGVAVPVTDNSGSLTVDAPVGTPVFVRLSDGAAAIATLPVSLAGNQATNVAQLAGTTTDTNSGVKSAGTLRVVLATDQPALTNKLLVTPDSVALPANQSVNVNQIAATSPVMKAASTAAAAADASLVVALSPNSPVQPQPSTTWATNTAAANTACTLTLAAPGAGLFHYITSLHISRNATAALAGTATLVITSTNITGSPAWSVGNAMTAGGTQNDVQLSFASPIKSTTANTATTIVAPAPGAAVLWRINATYYTGP